MAQANEKIDRNKHLKGMLAPHSVAIIGVSFKQNKAGYQAVKAFERFGGDGWIRRSSSDRYVHSVANDR
jgi:hypothetical protein